ncbi:SIR2 family protein [Paraburkholderia sp. EG287A]|uniref:SIR2 family protein n=1 Tax=unclassified Paraburkholderia TaxID=2615204 RepID=UPI0034D332CA
MRFIPNGPSLPDEPLTARDAGHVLFFCGAGVSQQDAKLPNFAVLAERVLDVLGSAMDSPARRLYNTTRSFEKASGLTGLVATDRIFGMLEGEFEASEVREAVAMSLRPDPGYVLDAHRALLDLSRADGGAPRIITTNFDLLFEECEDDLGSFNPPRLPDPGRAADFRGIVHLHGKVDADYRRACDDEFVLSSADFGHAYLSDGWATRYIQALLRRFHIVFVGYSADDPPVQYLLEAVNRFGSSSNKLYAFQSGDTRQALEQWAHKGVTPIPYESHVALWTTLCAWAERARDVDGWHHRLLEKALAGPQSLAPHERGMIAHVASAAPGTRYMATSEIPLPGEWLFVLDRSVRYAKPRRLVGEETETRFDPFDDFGLDSDETPLASDPADVFAERPVPASAWDGLEITTADLVNLPMAAATGLWHNRRARAALPTRLANTGRWLARVASQPSTLWWAAGHAPLHNQLQNDIGWSLRQQANEYTPEMRKGWRLLLKSWQRVPRDPSVDKYTIESAANRDGWSSDLVAEAIALYEPYLSVERRDGVPVPSSSTDVAASDVLRLHVEYPRPHEAFAFPDEALALATVLFRRQLEDVVVLEREVSGHDHVYLDTIRPDDGEEADDAAYALTGHAILLTKMVARLATVDLDAARQEARTWTSPDPLFTRLRIWSFGRAELTAPAEAGAGLLALSAEAFWDHHHERELLYSLRDRWHELPATVIHGIEDRLLYEPIPWATDHPQRSEVDAHCRLSRLHWLSAAGVIFSFSIEAESAPFLEAAGDWTPEAVRYTAQPQVSRVRGVQTDSDSSALMQIPVSEILGKAKELSKFRLEPIMPQPFHGLVDVCPTRALAALKDAMRKGVFPSWAWSVVLTSSGQRVHSQRMLFCIARRLAQLEPGNLRSISHPTSEWLRANCMSTFEHQPHSFDIAWDALRGALADGSGQHKFAIANRRWVDESLNSAVGRMLDALFQHPRWKELKEGSTIPEELRAKLEEMLSLKADDRRYAIVTITHRLMWLFHVDPVWVEARLLHLADGESMDSDAFWAGFFWAARVPQPILYERLKQPLIKLASEPRLPKGHAANLAGILLLEWARGQDLANVDEQLISDVELREVLIHAGDELRTSVLWHLRRFAGKQVQIEERLLPFLRRVWPRQRTMRTPDMTGRLVDLALSVPSQFSEVVKAIIPRLVPIAQGSTMLATAAINQEIFADHSSAMLDLLSTILPPDASTWPHGTGETLRRLAQCPEAHRDPRLAAMIRANGQV